MNSKNSKRIVRRISIVFMLAIVCVALMGSTMSAFAISAIDPADKLGADGGKYYSAFSNNEELQAVTKATNIEVAGEGAILLKNGGGVAGDEDMLPYKDIKNISLFGINSDAYGYGGTGSGSGQLAAGGDIYSSFENAGISINPKLKAMYQRYSGGSLSMVATYTTPTYEDKELPLSFYTPSVQSTYPRYNDAAFIVISRLGGEGTDLAVKNVPDHVRPDPDTGELVDFGDEHYLELTYREEQLIEHVQDNFEKVVILFNSGNLIEFGELENDPKIDAILHVGQTGDFGFDGILKIIKGEVNPSGRTVDIATADFTLDPVYQNFGNGSQTVETGNNYSYTWKASESANAVGVGSNMVEYEEGIYLGYKYYETMYRMIGDGKVDLAKAETKAVLNSKDIPGQYTDKDDWYAKNVIYPFGYGLSYTEFDWTDFNVTMSTPEIGMDTEFTATVTVKNTGDVAGKDVVELYMNAPYFTDGIEKSAVTLVGFAKTKLLEKDEEDTVTIKFDAYDIASYDYSDANGNSKTGYEIDAGEYEFLASKNSHDHLLSKKLTLGALHLTESQATGADIDNVFVASDDKDAIYNYTTISPTMTIMKRSDMIGTFPVAPTAAERELKPDEGINPLATDKKYHITSQEMYDQFNFGFIFGRDDETHEIWNVWGEDEQVIPDNWTQAADSNAKVDVRLPEMMGIDPYDTTSVVDSDNAKIDGKTHAAAWDVFMNQLTYEEIKLLNSTGFFKTAAIERLGKEEAVDPDGPCCIGGQTKNGYISQRGPSGTRYWCAAQMVAATWNVPLAKRIGRLIGEEGMWNGYNGWYAPSMNTHRSPFSGRNFEYYSQDGVHGGLIAGAVISGVSSRGIYPYIKHMALNDQETSRGGIATWADEQVIREIYLRPYQYSVEQGGASAVMTGFNRIGTVACSENYPMLTQILREEWGFHGIVVTDYQAGNVGDRTNNLEIMTRSGNNIPLGDKTARGGGQWDPKLRDGKGDVKVGKVTMGGNNGTTVIYSDTEFVEGQRTNEIQYYYARSIAMELLYTHTRSNAIDNGADFLKNFASRTIAIPAGVAGTKVIEATFDEDSDVTYELVSSELPTGVRFAANTLTLTYSNTTTVSTGKLSLKVSYDGWASKVVNLNISVVEPIVYTGANIVGKGTAYSATISQEYWKATPNLGASEAGTVSVTPTVTGLPAGLTFDAATETISGTATTAGEYNMVVKYTVVTRSVNSWGQVRDTTANYTRNVKLTVGTLVTVTVDGVAQKVESGAKMTAPEAPEAPEGKQFAGWFVGDDKFDFNTAITKDTILTSKFEKIPDTMEFRVVDGKVQAKINDGTWVDVIDVNDIEGKDGKGISLAAVNDKGELVLTYSDGTTANLGAIEGTDGKGISSAAINDKGELVITYSDGTSSNLGVVVGANGESSGCGSTIGVTTMAGLAITLLMGAVLIIAIRRKKQD